LIVAKSGRLAYERCNYKHFGARSKKNLISAHPLLGIGIKFYWETLIEKEIQLRKLAVFFTAAAMTLFFANTVFARDWNFYGSARMATFYTNTNLKDQGPDDTGRTTIKDTQWELQGNSRIGANVKGDTLDARFEFGAGQTTVTTRLLYGIWKFSDHWGLKVGQDFTPITFDLSKQVFDSDNNLDQQGLAYGLRRGQIGIEGRGFKFAAITPTSGQNADPDGNVGAIAVENDWPKLEASYQYVLADNMSAHVFGGWQNYTYYTSLSGGTINSGTINAFVIGAGGELNVGPVIIKPQVSWYRNGASAGWLGTELSGDSETAATPVIGMDGRVGDVDSFMAMLAFDFNPIERVQIEAGGGYLRSKGQIDDDLENTLYQLYLQAAIYLAPKDYLIPEIGYVDYGEARIGGSVSATDLGNLWYAGAKWQIDF
jgi:hypothetical protein